jgi:lysyl-tRNA synthetase class II
MDYLEDQIEKLKSENKQMSEGPSQCHTLADSLDLLEERMKELKDLANFAQRVLNNMNRQEPEEEKGCQKEGLTCLREPYPQSFAMISLDLGSEINRIGNLLQSIDNSIL